MSAPPPPPPSRRPCLRVLPPSRPSPELAQPPLREAGSGPGWRLLVADDGKPVPAAVDAILAIASDRPVPYVDLLDGEGRIALRLETSYAPMATLSPTANLLLISDIPGTDAQSGRLLVFELNPVRYRGQFTLPATRINYMSFFNAIAASNDGRSFYWIEQQFPRAQPCTTLGPYDNCDAAIVQAVDLAALTTMPPSAALPEGCGVPSLLPYEQAAILVRCTNGLTFLAEAVPGAAVRLQPAPPGLRPPGWAERGPSASGRMLRLDYTPTGDITGITLVDAAGGLLSRPPFELAWSVMLLDDTTALVMRPSGRLERLDTSSGDSRQLPYRLEPGKQGFDIALVR